MKSSEIAIERGVPVPKMRMRRDIKGVCALMDVGDSFAHPYQRTVTDLNKQFAPKRFYCGKHGNAYRVWRVE